MTKEFHIEMVDKMLSKWPENRLMRYCVKTQRIVHLRHLKTEKFACWDCEYHVLNKEGICDPL